MRQEGKFEAILAMMRFKPGSSRSVGRHSDHDSTTTTSHYLPIHHGLMGGWNLGAQILALLSGQTQDKLTQLIIRPTIKITTARASMVEY